MDGGAGGPAVFRPPLALVRRGRERIFEGPQAEALTLIAPSDEGMRFVRRWLFRAGYRNPSALLSFNIATIAFTSLGLVLALVLYASGLIERGLHFAGQIPGGVGDLMVPLIYLAPWTFSGITGQSANADGAHAPGVNAWLKIEQDLPITLELLATLSEAGLGFDAALERILQTQSTQRPLAREFRILQVEILAGRPRIQCLRRLSWRVETMSLTIFVSALVQTEQVGAGVSRRAAPPSRRPARPPPRKCPGSGCRLARQAVIPSGHLLHARHPVGHARSDVLSDIPISR